MKTERCRIPKCNEPRWPTFDGVCFDHGMFPETIEARAIVPMSARKVRRLAWECHDVAIARDAQGDAVTTPRMPAKEDRGT